VKQYYEQRAAEYDQWYEGTGLFASRERPGWVADREALIGALAALPPAHTLDVACGTGYLTRHLPGAITGLDQSPSMIEIASARLPEADFITADALPLPAPDAAFERIFTGHFYGHLEDPHAFLAEARRVAGELVIADSAVRPDHEPVEWQERVLNDGSRHEVYKRYFTGAGLVEELGGGEVLHEGPWFVLVRLAL